MDDSLKLKLKSSIIFFCILLSALAGVLSYPFVFAGYKAYDLGFLAWFFLIPLLIILKGRSLSRIFFICVAYGLFYYSGVLYWLVNAITEFGDVKLLQAIGILLLISLILASFFSISIVIGTALHRQWKVPLYLAIPTCLILSEFIVSFFPVSGFPWVMPAYTQGHYMIFFQWVDWTGVFGASLLIYFVNVKLSEILSGYFFSQEEKIVRHIIILFMVVGVCFSISLFRWSEKSSELLSDKKAHLIAVAQGNVAQEKKWKVRLAGIHIDRYLDLTQKAREQGADMILWPETAYPYSIDLGLLHKTPLFNVNRMSLPVVFGSVTQIPSDFEEDGLSVYNSAILMDRKKKIKGTYHKRHLVPFGEYVPLKKWISFARRLTVSVGDFSPGYKNKLIEYGLIRMGMTICYEDIFPYLSRENVLDGANLFVNLTNDAWYGHSSGPFQHLVFSQFRALENRRFIVRATNTGVSAFIDHRGFVKSSLEPHTKNIMIDSVYLFEEKTIYTRFGNWILYFATIVVLIFIIKGRNTTQIRQPQKEETFKPI